jgi:acyl-CoA dehydrogenase family protein 9
LSRTTRAIERRGEDGARREIDLCSLYVMMAHKRLRQVVSDFARNDDELRKVIASRAYSDRGYPFDVL